MLGALVSRNAFLAFIAINVSGLMRAIPIIAVLSCSSLIWHRLLTRHNRLDSTGHPAYLAQYLYRNSWNRSGNDEAAKGMGMTTLQIATRIQAPLVTPLVAAGIRTSAVQIIATATLAAFIGARGLWGLHRRWFQCLQ